MFGAETAVAPPYASLKENLHVKKASLTDMEMAVLSALLIDDPPKVEETPQEKKVEEAPKVLDNDILFSVPEGLAEAVDEELAHSRNKNGTDSVRRPTVTKQPEAYRFLVGLWQAHEDGVSPKTLSTLHSRQSSRIYGASKEELLESLLQSPASTAAETEGGDAEEEEEEEEDLIETESLRSDREVRPEHLPDDSSDSSWDEEEEHHFDAWQVLKDEYAKDFGFDYTPDGTIPFEEDESDLEHNTFKILGTSAEDKSAHPHVLSPPLIDAVLNFVPSHLQGQNMWMKYSLVRDGASLTTFKQYCRASKDTLLVIETTKGQVFGAYSSEPWQNYPTFFGGAPSFVFKMRHNRNSPCHSLLEQAQMEGEIDVFFLLDGNHRPQVCTSEMLGVGEGNVATFDEFGEVEETVEEAEEEGGKNYGFAIALEDDLLSGTTSKCASFRNPCFVNPDSNGEAFEVLNVELWTFTPSFSLDSAEKLEMTQYFVHQSLRNISLGSGESSQFSSRDLNQAEFYRRMGQGDDHEELRERWQYRNMMDGGAMPNKGMGGTPRFNNTSS